MPRFTARERRERYLRELKFQKKTGKPFFPHAVFHDTVSSLFFVLLIIGMTLLWHSGFGEVPADGSAAREGGFLGPAYEDRADPAVKEYDPKPEWYFFFLFELLRIFKTPELLLVGSIILPTILMVLLIAWPFLDRGPERRLSRRPFAMTLGVAVPVLLLALTWYGSAAPSVGGAASTNPGAAAFSQYGCGSCHTLADAGGGGNVGPNLDNTKPDVALVIDRVTNGQGAMPAFDSKLDETQIKCMSEYVATWAGGVGTPVDGYPDDCTAAGGVFAGAPG